LSGMTTRRRRGTLTKDDIARATLRVVGQHGVAGASTARVAAAAGVSEAALYRHFRSRHDMILAALDALYVTIVEIARSSTEENAIERLRQISRAHVAYASSHHDEFMSPFLAFVTSDNSDGFREQLKIRSQAATDIYVATIEEGKRQGTVAQDVDPEQAAWELIAAYWANAVAYAVGLQQSADKQRTVRMLDFIIDGMSAEAAG
jgi:AcrR family transcriptional regulator